MKVIGAGFGRTGTLSLKIALEKLGFGPCYHMTEVIKHPAHIRQWRAAADGQPVDWQALLKRYPSGVDYPLSVFYKELLAAFPDAKVILTIRDPDSWYESTLETIYSHVTVPRWVGWLLPPFRGFSAMVEATVWQRLFDGRFEDREYAISVFEAHIEEVKRTIPPENLLICDVSEGWEPLCAFLDVPVPPGDFPHANNRKSTQRLFLLARVAPIIVGAGLAGLLIWLGNRIF
jgi:hypothetical protein